MKHRLWIMEKSLFSALVINLIKEQVGNGFYLMQENEKSDFYVSTIGCSHFKLLLQRCHVAIPEMFASLVLLMSLNYII